MGYGPDLGHEKFLESLARFLQRHYKTTVDKQVASLMPTGIITIDYYRFNLVETSGATSGLHLLSSVFFGAGDLVFMEEFSYFLAINVLKEGLRFKCESG